MSNIVEPAFEIITTSSNRLPGFQDYVLKLASRRQPGPGQGPLGTVLGPPIENQTEPPSSVVYCEPTTYQPPPVGSHWNIIFWYQERHTSINKLSREGPFCVSIYPMAKPQGLHGATLLLEFLAG